MPARWKNIKHSNYHEQMMVRSALVAYGDKFGAESAARKFNVSLPTVYYWFKNLPCENTLSGVDYTDMYMMIKKTHTYSDYVIFE